jgi:hypothetical protein
MRTALRRRSVQGVLAKLRRHTRGVELAAAGTLLLASRSDQRERRPFRPAQPRWTAVLVKRDLVRGEGGTATSLDRRVVENA